MTTSIPSTNHPDVFLVGAGIMSATLAVFLKELDPSPKIELYEVLGSEAQESSIAWNNTGAGRRQCVKTAALVEHSTKRLSASEGL